MTAPLPLRRIHPLAKLALALIWLVVLTFVFDARFQGACILTVLGLLIVLDRAKPTEILLVLIPFALFGSGFLWSHWLHPAAIAGYAESVGGTAARRGGDAAAAIVLFLRAIAYGSVSYAFARTTDPADLVRALMQYLKLPAAFGYGLFSVTQFLPALRQEVEAMRMARALRSGKPMRRIPGPREMAGMILPLIASALRRADRSALAMELRGLAPDRPRSLAKRLRFRRADPLFLLAGTALLVGLYLLAAAI